MAPKGGSGSVGILDKDIGFSLERLFDEYNMDHVPLGKRLDGIQKRDLAHIKHYKAAVNIFGGPSSRKRVIIAPSMETPMKHRLGVYHNRKETPDPPILNSAVLERPPVTKPLTFEQKQAQEEEEKVAKYKFWMEERKKFRKNLEGMGLNEEYLANKPNKSDLEKRVAVKLEDVSRERAELIRKKTKPKILAIKQDLPEVPKIASPAPVALQIMDEHIKSKQLRLLDLFKVVDKDKNWKATKTEFKEAIKRAGLPITDKEVEDMIVCLDDDINDELDYSELAHGIKVWRKERRENRKKSNLSSDSRESSAGKCRPYTSSRKDGRPGTGHSISQDDALPSSPLTPCPDKDQPDSRVGSVMSRPRTANSVKRELSQGSDSKTPTPEFIHSPIKLTHQDSIKSGSKGSRGSSPLYLEVPEVDTSPGRMVLSSDEAMMDLIKHDKEVLRRNKYRKKHGIKPEDEPTPGVIKIGEKAIDDHSYLTTLGGSVGPLVDIFRQKRLHEYKQVVSLCQERGVVLTPKLLEKVLLYPPDKPYHLIKDSIAQPREPLLKNKFAEKPKQVKSTESSHEEKIKRSKSRQLTAGTCHGYRKGKQLSQNITKENLSTGKALIRTKVDTWMTFEEYERLTSKFGSRFKHTNKKSDDNAFWPGQLLHKLRLCMPPYDKPPSRDCEVSVFTAIKTTQKSNPGYDNDLNWWPISDSGYIQNGSIDKY